MELLVMALVLAAALIGQYFIYNNFGQRRLSYSLTLRRKNSGEVVISSDESAGNPPKSGEPQGASAEPVLEVFEDEEFELIEELDNAKPLPLPWVRTEISCGRWLVFKGRPGNGGTQAAAKDNEQKGLISGIFVLRPNQKCRRTWKVKCEKRGVFDIEDVSVAVSDLFGLVRSSRVIKLGKKIRALPVPPDMAAGEMSGDVFIGEIPVRRFVLPDPFVISGAREYTGREPMNRIHWLQSARCGSLMVYNNEFTTERSVLVVLNVQRSFHGERQKISLQTLETLIKGAAFILDFCRKTHTECAMTANSPDRLISGTGTGYGHTMTLLRLLAELGDDCGEHIDDFLPQVRFADFTDIVFISSFLDDRCAELLRGLAAIGKSVTILSTDISETDFCDVLTIPKKRYSIS